MSAMPGFAPVNPQASLGGGGSPMGGADMGFSTMFNISSGAAALADGLAAYTKSAADKSYYMQKAAISQRNAELVQQQIEDQKHASKQEQDSLRRKYNKYRKGINTGFAGRNLLLGGGTPLDALLSTSVVEMADIGIVKQNAARTIYGLQISKYNAQTDSAMFGGAASRITPGYDFATTMLSSGAKSAGKYAQWKNTDVTGARSSLNRALGGSY
tara:strand:+ start:32 stop:673 length:642 start_codon:yes stop_codon:yes gene_type:complete